MIDCVLFVQGEGKPRQADMNMTATINGKIGGETRVKDDVTKIEGIIEGNVKGSVRKGEENKRIEGSIEGRIEKQEFKEYSKIEKLKTEKL